MKRKIILFITVIFLVFFSFISLLANDNNKKNSNNNNFELISYFNYYSGFFPSNIQLTSTSFENSIYYIYGISIFHTINTNSKAGLLFNFRGFDWKNPYSIGLGYDFSNKFFDFLISYNFKSLNFLKFYSYICLYFTVDLYPYYFLKINGSFPFYPERLFLASENIISNQLSENFDISIDTGIYIFQNELFLKFKYFNIKDFYSSSSYYFKLQYFYAFGVRLIPTYTYLGYNFELSYTLNNYNNKFKYSILSATIGIIIRPFNYFYIKGNIGYNYWYFYSGTLINTENPIYFALSIEFSF